MQFIKLNLKKMEDKIKILFLDHTPFVGGAQLSLIEHIRKLDKNKFEIVVVCSKNAEKLGLTKKYKKLKIKNKFIEFGHLKSYNPVVFFRLLKSVRQLKSLIISEKADLLFGNTIRADIVGGLASLNTKAKTIWFIQDYTFPKKIFNLLSIIPKRIYYVSKSVADYYQVEINKNNRVLHIWRNTLEELKDFDQEQRDKIRKEWGVNKNTFVIGFVGRLVEWKGPQVLLEASRILKNKFNNFKFIFIGSGANQNGDNEDSLKKFAKKNGLNKNVIFTGYLNNATASLASLDVFCLTSVEPEPYSSVVIEAALAGVPLVGTNIGGTPEFICNGRGVLVSPNDSLKLAQILEKLYNNSEERKDYSREAFKEAKERNTSKYVTTILEQEYINLINNK